MRISNKKIWQPHLSSVLFQLLLSYSFLFYVKIRFIKRSKSYQTFRFSTEIFGEADRRPIDAAPEGQNQSGVEKSDWQHQDVLVDPHPKGAWSKIKTFLGFRRIFQTIAFIKNWACEKVKDTGLVLIFLTIMITTQHAKLAL